MRLTFLLLCALLVVATMPGCSHSRPRVWPAGPIHQQQQNASLHDPYFDNDLGPEVVGGRPREFEKPLSEPVRRQWWQSSWWSR